MAVKLAKSTFPAGHGPNDFECFGPPATKDGQFDGTMIVEMGCFKQDGVDTCKYYCACVCKSRINNAYYMYVEWGRNKEGNESAHPDFQFMECNSQAEAQKEYIAKCREKNDKRGEWIDKPGLGRILQAKKGKDCYLIRPLATRQTGLPDGRTIKFNEGAKVTEKKIVDKKSTAVKKITVDKYTIDLLRDLGQATLAYTKSNMSGSSLPTQSSIDEARKVLQLALQQVAIVGNDVDAQVADKELVELTSIMYGRIPKSKPLGAHPSTWILSSNNILNWQNDLDAFESALYIEEEDEKDVSDPYNGMNIHMEWLSPTSELGKFLHGWWPNATRNVHSNIGKMKILNAWKVEQHDQTKLFDQALKIVKAENVKEKCLHQPERIDLGDKESAYKSANVNLLFHASRSVNIAGILRERLKTAKKLSGSGVAINGAMFGSGALYKADDWKKSAQYSSLNNSLYSRGSGGVKSRGAFMFAADVIVGNPHTASEAYGYNEPPSGHHSVFGKGGHTKSRSGKLMNNEWMVYDTAQHQMRYLIEFTEDRPNGRNW